MEFWEYFWQIFVDDFDHAEFMERELCEVLLHSHGDFVQQVRDCYATRNIPFNETK